jgi:hypothetical protein
MVEKSQGRDRTSCFERLWVDKSGAVVFEESSLESKMERYKLGQHSPVRVMTEPRGPECAT